MMRCFLPATLGLLLLPICVSGADKNALPEPYRKLIALHRPLAAPRPGEWLAEHPEPGQTFRQYRQGKPVRPTEQRRTLCIQPLGDFAPTQRKILSLSAQYMEYHFGLPVRSAEPLSLDLVPAAARRTHPNWGDRQILAPYLLDKVLRPRLPRDAAAYLGWTASDLWPGEGWNFVFGLASLDERVGVWSLYRYGDPDADRDAFRLCLRRAVKVGVHETGHMFSMHHCTAYACVMNGSNHLTEADSRPIALCPECLAKVCWATGLAPEKHYERLADFCRRQRLTEDAEFFEKSLARLRSQ